MLILKKKIRVTEEDIFYYKLAKGEKQYANIINDNMISSALKKENLWPEWDILVFRDRLIVQKFKDDMKYFYSHPIYFCSTLIEYLRIHDCEEFLKLNEFDMTLVIDGSGSDLYGYWPYENLGFGTLTVNV